jgi:glycosyltransferase involved in cell wall biosynthesis
MRPLKIAMLTTFYPPHNFGGDGIGIQRLSRGLARVGCDVTVVHDTDAWRVLATGDEPEPGTEPAGIDVVRLKSRAPLVATLLTQQLGRPVVNGGRIGELLDRGDFDVINFHNISLIGGPGIWKYGRGLKLQMAHEHWLICPMHVLWRNGRERCDERRCLRCTLAHKRPPQLWRWTGHLERAARQIDVFIAMSEFSRRKHAEFGFTREMEVLPYFLPDDDEERPLPDSGPSAHDCPFFLFVGRLERIKGVDEIILAFRQIEGADLLVAGDGEYGPTLRALAAGDPRIHFLGRVNHDQLSRYYREALAVVVPSVCFETFGIILIEAFRQGTPVIARRLGPFPEIVEAAAAGDLFENEQELLAALRRFIDDGARRRRLGECGRRAFRRYWCESVVVPRYLDIVARAAQRRGNTDLADRARATGARTQ